MQKPVSSEITYGLERIATFVQNVESVYDIIFDRSGIKYKDIFLENEKQMSFFNFEYAPKDFCMNLSVILKKFKDPY